VPKYIAISNRRGGVGKSTITLMLACGLTYRGKTVLVVDLDPQASSTGILLDPGFAKEARDNNRNIVALLRRSVVERQTAAMQDYIATEKHGVFYLTPSNRFKLQPSPPYPPIHLVPGSSELDDCEIEALMKAFNAQPGLQAAFKDVQERTKIAIRQLGGAYDYIIMDCPPGLSHIVWGGLHAADGIVIPYIADSTAAENINWLINRLSGYDINAKRVTIANRYHGKDAQPAMRKSVEFMCPGFTDFHLKSSRQFERSLYFYKAPSKLRSRFPAGYHKDVITLADLILDWL